MFRKVLFSLFILLTVSASAGEQTGKVSQIVVRGSDNLHYFFLEGSSSNKPVCAKHTYWMIRDENSIAGKTQISLLLSAQAQQKTIRVVGSGSCTRWGDGEDVDAIFF
ncbi:hypothetical protein [Cellvibrio sp. PSBB023]|uniref:hypothetical protein n=1 Tax=Cellvibrio sp. PSBB023 TaxID=1945512 RepID=UPI00098EA565|nr:hypothetical protein [Cellvibrio sp. PSBB023]AQT61094.1 hypothetical protein B0D95_14075 [Cellvibrio sp. PSBB023]